jgi:TPR repeat protein
MMKPLLDVHTHTVASGHGYSTIQEMAQAAADKGHRKAQYRLGRCYDKGDGVKEDDKKAFELYQKSAKQDYAKAMYQLGRCYLKGKGVAANQEEAKKWLKRAISDDKHGEEILKDLRKAKADGEEATRILTLLGKKS